MIQHIFGRATKQGKEKLSVPKLKVWSTFSKVVGVGNAHKNFLLRNLTIAKRQAVWRLEHNGVSQMRQQQREKATLLKLLICHFLRAN